MPEINENFYRIQKLPPYVFAVLNEMKAKARAARQDVVDRDRLGSGLRPAILTRVVIALGHVATAERHRGVRQPIEMRQADHFGDLEP